MRRSNLTGCGPHGLCVNVYRVYARTAVIGELSARFTLCGSYGLRPQNA